MAINGSMSSSTAGWYHTVDVLVVGSGAGAMVTAITAHDGGVSTMLIEKSSTYGGNSARSGGGIWIPTNHLMKAAGIEDNFADALAYVKAEVGDVEPPDRIEAYVKTAPEMLKYLCDHTRLKPQSCEKYPDYHPSKPGWRIGRAVESKIFNAKELGDDLMNLHAAPGGGMIMGRYNITISEGHELLVRSPGWQMILLKRIISYWLDIPWRFKSKRSRDLTNGQALIASLRLSLRDRNIPLWLNSPARELIQENGRVVGALVEREDGMKVRVRANKGVVMSTGGFEGSTPLREKYLPNPTNAKWTCGSPHNTGDAIALGQAVGAKLDFMDYVCWFPIDLIPGKPDLGAQGKIMERSLPGTMMVNSRGERFMNEAIPYIDCCEAIYANNKAGASTVPCYMIIDSTFRAKYPYGKVLPGMPDATIPKGYLEKADTLEELAQKLGIDPAGLKATAKKFSEYAHTGVDSDFHRGENDYDRYYGDPAVKPNMNLGAIEKPPFYGGRVYPGDLGTTGGLKTDVHARVLSEQGDVIPGLYATGNCSASAIAGSYPGPGCTLGPAMTFAYIAARHLTQNI